VDYKNSEILASAFNHCELITKDTQWGVQGEAWEAIASVPPPFGAPA